MLLQGSMGLLKPSQASKGHCVFCLILGSSHQLTAGRLKKCVQLLPLIFKSLVDCVHQASPSAAQGLRVQESFTFAKRGC